MESIFLGWKDAYAALLVSTIIAWNIVSVLKAIDNLRSSKINNEDNKQSNTSS